LEKRQPSHDRLAAIFRDNRRSGFIYRSISDDNGTTWSRPAQTNFPDARSKFHGFRLQDGRYILVSNPNPKRRDPLALAISDDGLVFTKMGYLAGGRHVDYPHTMEHDGHLLIAFATGKQTVEVLRVRLEDLDSLEMPSAPLTAAPPYQAAPEDLVVDHRDADRVETVGPWGRGAPRACSVSALSAALRFKSGEQPVSRVVFRVFRLFRG